MNPALAGQDPGDLRRISVILRLDGHRLNALMDPLPSQRPALTDLPIELLQDIRSGLHGRRFATEVITFAALRNHHT